MQVIKNPIWADEWMIMKHDIFGICIVTSRFVYCDVHKYFSGWEFILRMYDVGGSLALDPPQNKS